MSTASGQLATRAASFDRRAAGLADFAEAYGDQTERDHDRLVKAIKAGKVAAAEGV